jgi:RNA polymerase-binding transcription factor DksA
MQLEDWASSMEQKERDAAVARARSNKTEQGNGICRGCLEPVEAERSTALRCLSCQQDFEHRQRIKTGGRRV